jgi:hypothetical protein
MSSFSHIYLSEFFNAGSNTVQFDSGVTPSFGSEKRQGKGAFFLNISLTFMELLS